VTVGVPLRKCRTPPSAIADNVRHASVQSLVMKHCKDKLLKFINYPRKNDVVAGTETVPSMKFENQAYSENKHVLADISRSVLYAFAVYKH